MKFQLICCLASHSPPAMLLSPANNIKKELHWYWGSWWTWFSKQDLLQDEVGWTLWPHGPLCWVMYHCSPTARWVSVAATHVLGSQKWRVSTSFRKKRQIFFSEACLVSLTFQGALESCWCAVSSWWECHLSVGFRAETGWGHSSADQKEARKIQGNSVFLHLTTITSSPRLKRTHFISTSVLPSGVANSKCLGKDTRKGWLHRSTSQKVSSSPYPFAALQWTVLDGSFCPVTLRLLISPCPSSPLSPSGAADRTGVVSAYWELEGVPKGWRDNHCHLCSSDAWIPRLQRDPGRGRLGASFPAKKAAVLESKDKAQDQVLHLQPGVGFKYKSHYNSFPLPFSLCCSELLALHSTRYSACSM